MKDSYIHICKSRNNFLSNIGLNSEKLPQLTCMIVNELREDP